MLKNIIETENVIGLQNSYQNIERIANKWSNIRGMLVKAYYKEDYEKVIPLISEEIYTLADMEESVLNELKDMINNKSSKEFKELVEENSKENIEEIELNDIYCLDIKKYLNNKGIGLEVNGRRTSDLTDTGEGNRAYFLADDKMKEQDWKYKNIVFKFPDIFGDYDNISCDKQLISIDSENMMGGYIFILGCAEWGNYSEKCTINYKSGTREEIALEFTDWYFKSVFDEDILWVGHAVEEKLSDSLFKN